MATRIRKKVTAAEAVAQHTISTDSIIATSRGLFNLRPGGERIFELISPIKPLITIKIDAYGQPNIKTIDMGVQHEHYSTWLKFDLSELLWQINTSYNPFDNRGYEEEQQYAMYIFTLFFKDRNTDEVYSWEFDGIDFQIPRELTFNATTYEIALVIQEHRDDEDEGNLPDDYSPFIRVDNENVYETFISYSWLGTVRETYFTPDLLEGIESIEITDTSQTRALIKPAIDCRLADDGFFSLETPDTSLGMYNDNYVRYLRFNPGNITAHLNEFYVFAIYKQNNTIVTVSFEQTETGAYDDTTQPLISWIPSEVYNRPGQWRVMIAAISKNYRTENPNDDEYTDLFYRFLSDKITMTVDPGFVEDFKLIKEADEQYYISDFITADEQVIIGKDNAILRGEK